VKLAVLLGWTWLPVTDQEEASGASWRWTIV
jgi:hypothetical protein